MRFRTTTKRFDSISNARIDLCMVDLTCFFRCYFIFNVIEYTKVLEKRFTCSGAWITM